MKPAATLLILNNVTLANLATSSMETNVSRPVLMALSHSMANVNLVALIVKDAPQQLNVMNAQRLLNCTKEPALHPVPLELLLKLMPLLTSMRLISDVYLVTQLVDLAVALTLKTVFLVIPITSIMTLSMKANVLAFVH